MYFDYAVCCCFVLLLMYVLRFASYHVIMVMSHVNENEMKLIKYIVPNVSNAPNSDFKV